MKKRNSPRKKKAGTRKRLARKRNMGTGLPLWRQPVIWGFLLAAAAFVTMVMYGRLPAPPSPVATQQTSFHLDDTEILGDVRVEVESLLWQLGLETGDVTQEPSEGVLDLRLRGDFPATENLMTFKDRLEEISPELRFDRYVPGQELRVFNGPALIARLRFELQARTDKEPGPAVTIIMDDIGRSLPKVRRLLAIQQPVTLAILPSTPHASEAADLAQSQGREVMLHIPMEPQGYPAIEPGRDALLLQHDAWEVKRRLSDMFRRVPYAVGGNNHMGSRYTEYAVGMQAVGEFFRDHGLLFIDSRTTGKTLAAKTMRQHGVPAASRDVFLDNQQDVDKIRAQIRHLVAQAKRHGQAIGLCHPYDETLEALEYELPLLVEAGVDVITVTQMVRRVQERGN